jgi:PAS domain S-box-containing protein
LPAAVYLLAVDGGHSLVFISSYIEELAGRTAADMLAQPEPWLSRVHPEDRERVAGAQSRAISAGEPYSFNYRYRRTDGSYLWVWDQCAPVRDRNDRIIAWQGVLLDVSDRVRLAEAEAEARAREEQRDQLRVILDNLPAGVLIVTGPDERVEQANARAIQMIFGDAVAPDHLPIYGRDFRLLWADETPRTHQERSGLRALRGELVTYEQLLLAGPGGRQVPVLAHAAPLPPSADGIARAVLVLQDVTRLREADQLKEDFLALVSHEFRTPLTAIHGGAHLLRDQGNALDEVTRRELLADIVVESARLDRMLTNILYLTEAVAGRLAVSTEPVLLGPLVARVAAEVAGHLSQHTLRIAIPADLPPAEADPALLGEVLTNLFGNAAKYSPVGGEIVTTATSDGQTVIVAVADTGIGIAPEQIALIFQRFHRADIDSTVRGMGLGLYLSRFLIEAQGGTITAHSPGLGQGATFAVRLPIAREWQADQSTGEARSSGNGWA